MWKKILTGSLGYNISSQLFQKERENKRSKLSWCPSLEYMWMSMDLLSGIKVINGKVIGHFKNIIYIHTHHFYTDFNAK